MSKEQIDTSHGAAFDFLLQKLKTSVLYFVASNIRGNRSGMLKRRWVQGEAPLFLWQLESNWLSLLAAAASEAAAAASSLNVLRMDAQTTNVQPDVEG